MLGSAIALAVIRLLISTFLPSMPLYRFASVNEARSYGHAPDAPIFDELGDTNGPYKLAKSFMGKPGIPFSFNITFDGRSTNWSQPVSENAWFIALVFQNPMGNQFAVIRKATD